MAIEDGKQSLEDLHRHDQREEPEREPVTAIRVVDALGKKLVEHAGPAAAR